MTCLPLAPHATQTSPRSATRLPAHVAALVSGAWDPRGEVTETALRRDVAAAPGASPALGIAPSPPMPFPQTRTGSKQPKLGLKNNELHAAKPHRETRAGGPPVLWGRTAISLCVVRYVTGVVHRGRAVRAATRHCPEASALWLLWPSRPLRRACPPPMCCSQRGKPRHGEVEEHPRGARPASSPVGVRTQAASSGVHGLTLRAALRPIALARLFRTWPGTF